MRCILENVRIPTYKAVYFYLTHMCDSWCTFCYRKGLYKRNNINKLGDMYMSEETALKIAEFVLSKLQLDDAFNFYFWGGEPFLNFKVMKRIITEYPQFQYHTNTNGAPFTQEMSDFLRSHTQFSIAWSLGNAYERYGGVQEKVKQEPIIAKFIKETDNNSCNLVVTKYDNLFNDFIWLTENVTKNVTIDIASKFEHKDEDLEDFANEYIRIIDYFKDDPIMFRAINPALKSNIWIREFGPKSMLRPYHFCKSGLQRLFIDTVGGIWQCDNMYICQHNKLGDIENGIDYSKLDLMYKILDDPEPYLGRHCEDCEIYQNCTRNKCLGLNLEWMGDMFKPEPSFCKMCKVLYKVAHHYVEQEKVRRGYAN